MKGFFLKSLLILGIFVLPQDVFGQPFADESSCCYVRWLCGRCKGPSLAQQPERGDRDRESNVAYYLVVESDNSPDSRPTTASQRRSVCGACCRGLATVICMPLQCIGEVLILFGKACKIRVELLQ